MRNCDDEKINDLNNPSSVNSNPEKYLAARRSRQKLTNSEKLYIFKTATSDPNWVSEMLWKFNLSYGCLLKIIKVYPKIAAQLELKRWETKERLCIQNPSKIHFDIILNNIRIEKQQMMPACISGNKTGIQVSIHLVRKYFKEILCLPYKKGKSRLAKYDPKKQLCIKSIFWIQL